jgi:hypothetical protein
MTRTDALLCTSILGALLLSLVFLVAPAHASSFTNAHGPLAVSVGSGLPGNAASLSNQGGEQKTLSTIIGTMTGLVMSIVPILASLALLFFFYNLFLLVMNTGDAEKHKQARPRLLWSIIVMLVIFSVWGIVALLSKTFFDSTSGSMNSGTPFTGIPTKPFITTQPIDATPP